MKRILLTSLVLLSSAFAFAQAPTPSPASPTSDGWIRVVNLSQGDSIAVTLHSGETYRCSVTIPSDVSLACSYMRGSAVEQDYEFAREDILEVRRRHPGRDFAIVAGVAGGVALAGAARQNAGSYNAQNAALSAVVAGSVAALIAAPFIHMSPGNLVYRKPHSRPHLIFWKRAPSTHGDFSQ